MTSGKSGTASSKSVGDRGAPTCVGVHVCGCVGVCGCMRVREKRREGHKVDEALTAAGKVGSLCVLTSVSQ